MRQPRFRGVLALLAAVLLLGSCAQLGGRDTYQVTVLFPRAVSLFEQSQVLILGLPVGVVRSVEPEGGVVRVEIEVDVDVPLPVDVQASLLPRSLIGERAVQLFPAWREGQPRLEAGDVIPLERTVVPVEPDEALEALRDFLDSLDPDATGRLITNLAGDLEGNGESINRALESLSQLMGTFATKSDTLVRIVEQLDRFTATLVTREAQLGRVLDDFAQLTATLARERAAIEGLLAGLARLSADGLDLVAGNAQELQEILQVLGRTLRSVDANLESVRDLLDAGPILVEGLDGAFNPEQRRIDLRNSFSPVVSDALRTVLDPLGVDIGEGICLPLDVDCPTASSSPSGAERVAGALGAAGRFVRGAAVSLVGAGR